MSPDKVFSLGAKWVAVVGLLCGAFYQATMAKPVDLTTAYTLFTAALGMAGFAVSIHRTSTQTNENAKNLEVVKEDLKDIRNNPNMPGTPMK